MGFRKLLIAMILLSAILVSCKPSSPCIQECYLENDSITVTLNMREYKVGIIEYCVIGNLYFGSDAIEDKRKENKFILHIKDEKTIFENGEKYTIYLCWSGGNVVAIGKFENGKFMLEEDEKFSKKPRHLQECYMEDGTITIVLDVKNYTAGIMQYCIIGDLYFEMDAIEDRRREGKFILYIKDEKPVFENGENYKIYLRWYGGYVTSNSIFKNRKFIMAGEEVYYNKDPF